ncbi:MAG: hypothetical protein HY302_04900 [Opitutae bacterium]|nr:hypothetical protein [Opitutae bacterium]
MKRVLIISPHFPPVNAPDCQRVRMSLPFYREFGWEPVVLAAEPQHRADWHDLSLLATLPADIEVHHCPAMALGLSRLVGISNLGIRVLPYLNRAAQQLLRNGRFDLVYFSTTQFVVTPLGRLWRRRFGVPYVIDLQDPWRNDYYERPGAPPPPGGWKYQFARFTAWLFEERTFAGASAFVSVSHHYFRDLARRYPWFQKKLQTVVPFGAPQADFDYLARHPEPPSITLLPAGCRHWVAAGSLGPGFSHSLRVLFAGLRRLRDADPAAASRLRLHFVGTSYAPASSAQHSARPVAAAYGVADLVVEQPERIGYLDSLRLLQSADGLLLLGSDDRAYSPSKIYPYYMTRRPIIALAHADSLLAELLTQLRCAHVVTLLKPGEETQPPGQIAALLARAAASETLATPTPLNLTLSDRFLSARAVTARQCAVFDQVLARRAAP